MHIRKYIYIYPPAPLGATRLRSCSHRAPAQFFSAAVLSAIAIVFSAAVSLSNSSSPLSIAVLLAAAESLSLPLPPSCSPPPKGPKAHRSPNRPVSSALGGPKQAASRRLFFDRFFATFLHRFSKHVGSQKPPKMILKCMKKCV